MLHIRQSRFLIQQKRPMNEAEKSFAKTFGENTKAYRVGHVCKAVKVVSLPEGHFGLFLKDFLRFCIRNGFIDLKYGVLNRFLFQKRVPLSKYSQKKAKALRSLRSIQNLKCWSKAMMDFDVTMLESSVMVTFYLMELEAFPDLKEHFWTASTSEARYKVFYSLKSLNLTPWGDLTG